MKKIENFILFRILHQLEDAVLIIATVAILIMTLLNILMRYVFYSAIIWSDEFIGFGMLIIGLIGTAGCVRDKLNTSLDGLMCKLPRKLQTAGYFLINIMVMILLSYFCAAGFRFLGTVGAQKSTMLKWPMVFFYGLIPVSCILYIIETLLNIAEDIRNDECRFIPIEEHMNSGSEQDGGE